MKKRIAIFITAIAIALALPVGAAAQTTEPSVGSMTEQTEGVPTDVTSDESTSTGEIAAPKGGLSEWITSLFANHSAEIFSVLSLLGSVLVAILYKTGLLPLLSKHLAGLRTVAGGTAESTAELARKMENATSQIGAAADYTAAGVDGLREAAEETTAKLDALQEAFTAARDDNERMRLILKGQTDLIYGVLQAAALPQYQKDAMSEQYVAMQRALAAMEREVEA